MRKKLTIMLGLMSEAAPTSAEPSRKAAPPADQQQLVVQLPDVTVQEMKLRALERRTTVRVMLLEALRKDGYTVPAGQAVDFRKEKRARPA